MSFDNPPAGWSALTEAIAAARGELLASTINDQSKAEADAYLLRVVTASLADGFLGHLFTSDGLTRALPTKGGPNPDYLMSHTLIDPSRSYVLEGQLHDSERVGIGVYSFSPTGAAMLESYAAFSNKTLANATVFKLQLSADAQGPGTLQLPPSSRVLLIRTLHRNSHGRPAQIAVQGGAAAAALPHGATERTLTHIAQSTLRSIKQFIRWSQLNAATPNRFFAPPADMANEIQADPDTHYALGRYELGEGQWLDVEIPKDLPGYWSLHAYNHWCEFLSGASAHDLNTQPNDDGAVRIRIGPAVVSASRNRIDTQGRRSGVLIFRTLGAAAQTLPLAELKST